MVLRMQTWQPRFAAPSLPTALHQCSLENIDRHGRESRAQYLLTLREYWARKLIKFWWRLGHILP
jgi:hypothetical protein